MLLRPKEIASCANPRYESSSKGRPTGDLNAFAGRSADSAPGHNRGIHWALRCSAFGMPSCRLSNRTLPSGKRPPTDAPPRQNSGKSKALCCPKCASKGGSGLRNSTIATSLYPLLGNNTWLNGRTGSVVARQLLFDGFTSINEIWRQTARVDAAAHRTHERTELIALDATEAYIDVARYTRLVALAQENVAAHKRIYSNVNSRFQGGRAGEGDLQQALERVAAAEAALAEFRRSLDDARAKFRKVVGLEPINLRFPGRLPSLPGSRDESLAVTLRHNPTIKAAQSDSRCCEICVPRHNRRVHAHGGVWRDVLWRAKILTAFSVDATN